MQMVVTASAPSKCDANATGVSVTAWGFDSLPCQVRTGLRSFTDREGVVRFYCGSLGHEADARRRFGLLDACYFCGRIAPILDGIYTRIDFAGIGVRNVCDLCREKADTDGSDDE